MSLFRKILTVTAYVAAAGGPVLAATGVGVPAGAVLGAIGAASAAWLHFLDSPRSPKDLSAVVESTADATKTVQGAVTRGKG